VKLKIDLHVHTSHSPCALLKPSAIEGIALKRGLDGIAVTDHNTMDGYREIIGTSPSITVIPAEEIRTSQGEITGYFLQEPIPALLSPAETVREIRRQGGLVAIPHPFDTLRSSRISRKSLAGLTGSIDMIEVFNARDIRRSVDRELLASCLQHGAVPIVGSDAHLGIELGRACMVIEEFRSPAEFLDNLKTADSVARRSPLWVHLVTKCIKPFRKKKTGG